MLGVQRPPALELPFPSRVSDHATRYVALLAVNYKTHLFPFKQMTALSRRGRRGFLQTAGVLTTTLLLPPAGPTVATPMAEGPHLVGPLTGYTPQVGTLVSMMQWMRRVVLDSVEGMGSTDLDYLHDAKANSIGAMLLHLAGLETFYQLNTFADRRWGDWDETDQRRWNAAVNLGEEARRTIRGNPIDYYLNILHETREKTLAQLKKRDDAWLLTVDRDFAWGPTNNYCKWFHVCEHESNHNGQIRWIKSRLPGRK